MISVTVDHNVWIDWLDQKRSHEYVNKIVEWHKQKRLELWAVSRGEQDAKAHKSKDQWDHLLRRFKENNISVSACPARLSFSARFGGPDVLSGLKSLRTTEELEEFYKLVPNPIALNQAQIGDKMSNKLGDYDCLTNHFSQKRDVFLTLEKRDIFLVRKRDLYKDKLGLIILSPQEFVEQYGPTMT